MFSPTLLFALSNFVFVTQLFSLPIRFIVRRFTILYFLAAFKMGVKDFRIGTMPMRSQHDAFFQIHHGSLVFAEMPSFKSITIVLFAPRCHLLLHHNIYVSPWCPSFVAPRYLWFHHDALLSVRHDIYDFTAMPIFCSTTIFMNVHQTFYLEMG